MAPSYAEMADEAAALSVGVVILFAPVLFGAAAALALVIVPLLAVGALFAGTFGLLAGALFVTRRALRWLLRPLRLREQHPALLEGRRRLRSGQV